jgi:Haem-binding domain
MNRILKRTLLVTAAGLLVAQFVGPRRTNPPSDPAKSLARKTSIPRDVDAILTRSCRNCHSNETRWPWYAYVAPPSWSVIGHVNEGRAHLNFSDWTHSSEEGADLLDGVCKEIRRGRMPVPSYTWIHRDAALSDADKKRLCRWAADAADDLMNGTAASQ